MTPEAGGQAGGKGYLLQSMVAILGSLEEEMPEWKGLTLEPNSEKEKVDILWRYETSTKASQVKHSKNTITKPDAKKWAAELEANTVADSYSLVLLGVCSTKFTKLSKHGKVSIPSPLSNNVDAILEQAAHKLDHFLRRKNRACTLTPTARELLVDALTNRLSAYSSSGTEVSREAFESLLWSWIHEIDPKLGQEGDSPSSAQRQRYSDWVESSFSSFFVPGLNVTMPIEEAWIRLNALKDDHSIVGTKTQLDEQLQNYLEFGQRVRRLDRESTVISDSLPLTREKSVLVGGPGAGKSTTLKRFAWQLSREGWTVLHVRLPVLVQHMQSGRSFEDALEAVAFDGYESDSETRKAIIGAADLLLCDGLDECDPHRSKLADQITRWGFGHPKCRICVATRPVGHETALLPGFVHFGLREPDESDIRTLSCQLFRRCCANEEAGPKCSEFQRSIDSFRGKKHAKQLASQNPLLLGFLIRLHIDDVDFGSSRVDLYASIFQMMLRTPANDREAVHVSERIALAFIQALAWKRTESPFASNDEAMEFVASHLRNTLNLSTLEADDAITDALAFWESRRLLETISAGVERKTFFVHMSLQEFAAAKFAITLDNSALSAWVKSVHRRPSWKQVILLSCGLDKQSRIMDSLLAIDEPSDPVSCEALLVCDGFHETSPPLVAILPRLIEALVARFSSEVPLVSIEAVLQLANLSPFADDAIRGSITDLQPDSPWTKLGRLLLRLTVDPDTGVVDEFKDWFSSYKPVVRQFPRLISRDDAQSIPEEARDVQDEIVKVGFDRLLARDSPHEIEIYLRGVTSFEHLSAFLLEEVKSRFSSKGMDDAIEKVKSIAKYLPDMASLEADIKRCNRGQSALLKLIAQACRCEQSCESEPPFMALSRFFTGLGFWSSTAGAISAMDFVDLEKDHPGMAVARALAKSLNVELSDLGTEAKAALERCTDGLSSFTRTIVQVDAEEDWSRLENGEVDSKRIAEGILHPFSLFAVTAAKFVDAGFANDEAKDIIPSALNSRYKHVIRLGALLSYRCFDEKATDLLLQRLESGVTSFDAAIFEALARYSTFEQRQVVSATFAKALLIDNADFVEEITETLVDFRPPLDHTAIEFIRAAYQLWTSRKLVCKEHGEIESGGSCPECIFVPKSPRAGLLRQLDRLGEVSANEWFRLTSDSFHAVADLARQKLIELAASDDAILCRIIEEVSSGSLDPRILDQTLKLPIQAGSIVAQRSEALLRSDDLGVRLATISQLTGEWIEPEQAIKYLRKALKDEIPCIRTLAARTLRLFH